MNAIAYKTKLESDTVHLRNVDKLIGKEVIITVVEVDEPRPQKRKKVVKKKLSALKGKVTKMDKVKIDEQLKALRDEWQRDI